MWLTRIHTLTLFLSRIVLLLVIHSITGVAQEAWREIPSLPGNPQDSHLKGIIINARATINKKHYDACIVVSGANKSGLYSFGIWIKDLFNIVPERVFWPYMGPDLGNEAMNPNMVVISLFENNKKKYVSKLNLMVRSGGNYPNGVFKVEDSLLDACGKKRQMNSLIKEMSSGFDYGIVIIGHGIFKFPVEIKFEGKDVKVQINKMIKFIDNQN